MLKYWLNGVDMGYALQGLFMCPSSPTQAGGGLGYSDVGLYPAASLSYKESVRFAFSKADMR